MSIILCPCAVPATAICKAVKVRENTPTKAALTLINPTVPCPWRASVPAKYWRSAKDAMKSSVHTLPTSKNGIKGRKGRGVAGRNRGLKRGDRYDQDDGYERGDNYDGRRVRPCYHYQSRY